MNNVIGKSIRFLMVFVFFSTTAICQSRIEMGIRGGIPFNEAFQPQINSPYRTFTSDRPRYSVGPSIRVLLVDHLAVQLDAIYTHSRWDRADVPGYYGDVLLASAHYNRWDFPALATLATSHRAALYIGGGVAFHHSTTTFRTTIFSPTGTSSQYAFNSSGDDARPISIVLNGGLRWKMKSWSLEPEIRYSRVRSDLRDSYRNPAEIIRTPNQFQFMLGVMVPSISRN